MSLLNVVERLDNVIRAERDRTWQLPAGSAGSPSRTRRVSDERNVGRAVEQNVIVERRDSRSGSTSDETSPEASHLVGSVTLNCSARSCRESHPRSQVAAADERLHLRINGRIEEGFGCRGRMILSPSSVVEILPLLVEIDDQAAFAALLADAGDQPAKVRFADAPLEIQRRNNSGRALSVFNHGAKRSRSEQPTKSMSPGVAGFSEKLSTRQRSRRLVNLSHSGIRPAAARRLPDSSTDSRGKR